MDNKNIAIGIDLGTSNSKISVNVNGKIEIIKKPGGVEYTPSVFGFDKSGNKVIGQKAYDHLYKFNEKGDNENFKAEVKRLMGTSETVDFPRAKVKMSPEEISAEILKGLKEDLTRKYPNFDTNAVVITVPAALSILHSEATKRAGNLAGFEYVVLLQEPIAAAISYGFMNAKNENWLIYDFGGGTFDLALVSCKDGVLSVLGHGGEGYLGGKDIDWKIVNNIIVPRILEKYKFTDFKRSNEKYEKIFSRLKYFAESSKIELSQYSKTTIDIEEVGKDDLGKDVTLSIPFSRNEFNKLLDPIVDQTIELAKGTIKECGLKNSSIKRIILVGGTTLIPYIRERLEEEMKITVDSSVDPLTIVANGACVFGISQKIPEEFSHSNPKKIKSGTHAINLHYSALTSDTEESITGSVENLDEKGEYFVQIQSDSGTFASSKIKLNKGKFYCTVKVEKNRQNLYWIYLFDGKSNPIKISPESFNITHGISISGSPLPNSIKIVVADKTNTTNVCEDIFTKEETLPLKKTLDAYKTSKKLWKGEANSLNIRIVEGESSKEEQNNIICELGISGKQLPHDLPEKTPIEFTIELNESRELSVKAYIPLIDMHFNARATLKAESIEIDDIAIKLEEQRKKAEAVLEYCTEEERQKISSSMQSVTESLSNSKGDEDEKRRANKQLKTLMILLDNLKGEKEMPQLLKEYNSRVEEAGKIINDYADPSERDEDNERLDAIKTEGEIALKRKDKVVLNRLNEELGNLALKAAYSNPNTWITYFKQIVQAGNFTNQKEAEYYINKGSQSIALKNYEELKHCVMQLSLLRPLKQQKGVDLSGITR